MRTELYSVSVGKYCSMVKKENVFIVLNAVSHLVVLSKIPQLTQKCQNHRYDDIPETIVHLNTLNMQISAKLLQINEMPK